MIIHPIGCSFLFFSALISGFDYFRFPEVYRAVEKEELTAFIQQVVTRSRAALSVIQPCKEETL